MPNFEVELTGVRLRIQVEADDSRRAFKLAAFVGEELFGCKLDVPLEGTSDRRIKSISLSGDGRGLELRESSEKATPAEKAWTLFAPNGAKLVAVWEDLCGYYRQANGDVWCYPKHGVPVNRGRIPTKDAFEKRFRGRWVENLIAYKEWPPR